MRVPATIVKHKVGMCPACRFYLWAECDVEVVVGDPTITEDGKARVYADPRIVGMRVEHSCSKETGDSA